MHRIPILNILAIPSITIIAMPQIAQGIILLIVQATIPLIAREALGVGGVGGRGGIRISIAKMRSRGFRNWWRKRWATRETMDIGREGRGCSKDGEQWISAAREGDAVRTGNNGYRQQGKGMQ
jgi:hypothetical protein